MGCAGWDLIGTRAGDRRSPCALLSVGAAAPLSPTLASRLVDDGRAYYCFCSAESLREERDEARGTRRVDARPRPACRSRPTRRVAQCDWRATRDPLQGAGRARPPFVDGVHGAIDFDCGKHRRFRDPAIGHGYPTYHLSVVVDDVDMGITQVIRGDDHISNTPKHVLLFEALGVPVPRFAHVPLILGADKKRLSKRHGATSVIEYARQGYLPDAMVNFLALLGLVAGQRRSGAVHARRVDRGVRAGGHQRRQRRVQSGEAGLDERPAHHAAVGGRTRDAA